MKTLIGISGRKGSGKDTTGNILSEYSGFKTYALAYPIKQICNTLFDFPLEENQKEVINLFKVNNWKTRLISLSRDYLGEIIDNISDIEFCNLFYKKVVIPYLVSENETIQSISLKTSPRKIYQLFGTDFIRSINSNAWLDLANIKYKNDGSLIVTDIRFDNEAKFIKDNNGLIINILRDSTQLDTHASESGISKNLIDVNIDNNGTMEELKNSIELIMNYHISDPIISLYDLI